MFRCVGVAAVDGAWHARCIDRSSVVFTCALCGAALCAQDALRRSVSRERVGSAFMRILSAAPTQVARAVELLDELQLSHAILLPVATDLSIVQADGSAAPYAIAAANSDRHAIWHRSCACAQEMASVMTTTAQLGSGSGMDDAEANNTTRLLAAFVLPFVGHRVQARDVSVPTYMLRESLKVRLAASATNSGDD